ncbi:hypothetical protein PMIN01_09786 [Paraphaeosphaeria minitans]|uniref:Uncharacterized protein n=1 Tax=Paraphaeosphaeria minitans TaxID=565426 RepID=A0A9P6KME3_9PLEO|nr:hypothetical protein PMIN01_09786 [Paraphaeosphaeria minitans]
MTAESRNRPPGLANAAYSNHFNLLLLLLLLLLLIITRAPVAQKNIQALHARADVSLVVADNQIHIHAHLHAPISIAKPLPYPSPSLPSQPYRYLPHLLAADLLPIQPYRSPPSSPPIRCHLPPPSLLPTHEATRTARLFQRRPPSTSRTAPAPTPAPVRRHPIAPSPTLDSTRLARHRHRHPTGPSRASRSETQVAPLRTGVAALTHAPDIDTVPATPDSTPPVSCPHGIAHCTARGLPSGHRYLGTSTTRAPNARRRARARLHVKVPFER